MTRVLGIATAGALLACGLLTAAACGGQRTSTPGTSSATVPHGTTAGQFVSALGVVCKGSLVRVRFDLARPVVMSGRLEYKPRPGTSWKTVRVFAARRVSAGHRGLGFRARPRGAYRVRLRFKASSGRAAVRTAVTHAGCPAPPPVNTTPTLPGSTGTVPVQ